MDFKNEHTGRISINDKLLVYDDSSFGYKISDEEIDKLLEIIKRNMK